MIAADGVMHSYKIRAHAKGAFDHELGQGVRDTGQDVASAQKGRAQGHEGRDAVVAIADEFV